jgi:hypothetical protein
VADRFDARVARGARIDEGIVLLMMQRARHPLP